MKRFILLVLSLALLLSLASCGEKAVYSDYHITVAKSREDPGAEAALSKKDTVSLMETIRTAEKENEWIDAVSDSIASCFLSIETAGETTRYQYSDSGVLDDLTHMRSLTLKDAKRDAVNELLARYVDLKIPLAAIPHSVIPISPVSPADPGAADSPVITP